MLHRVPDEHAPGRCDAALAEQVERDDGGPVGLRLDVGLPPGTLELSVPARDDPGDRLRELGERIDRELAAGSGTQNMADRLAAAELTERSNPCFDG
jgi:hypothetical protein